MAGSREMPGHRAAGMVAPSALTPTSAATAVRGPMQSADGVPVPTRRHPAHSQAPTGAGAQGPFDSRADPET